MANAWFVISGVLLIGFALAGTVLKRLPVTPAMFYLAAGAWLGPWGAGLLHIDALDDTALLERLTEVAVIVSSIVIHGVSVTPLMRLYSARRQR